MVAVIRRFALAACIFLAAVDQRAAAAVKLPQGSELAQVDFERHVMGLFGRMGCSMGSCHGSFQGKGGMRLSLFGFDPELDFRSISRDSMARRISAVNPEESLLLLKATGQVEHGGGVRFSKDSWQYQVFRQWLAEGARWTAGSGTVEALILTPPEIAFKKSGETSSIRVEARFADGSREDVTSFCDFRTNDDAVAEVTNLGQVKSLRAGSTAIVVSYRGNVLPVRILIPQELPVGFQYPKVPAVNYVDSEVFARLKLLNMVPSELASDEEFLRRVTIDTLGSLPTPEQVRAFLADKSLNKREKKIDELLAHPLHAAMWATKFSDITGNDTNSLENPNPLKFARSQAWHDWFRVRVESNVPYDEIVRGVLTATSREGLEVKDWIESVRKIDAQFEKNQTSEYVKRKTLDLFWRRQQAQTIEQWGERTAAAFLGVRLECAQCHKHPFDRWSQADYRAYANVFASLSFGISKDAKKVIDQENNVRKGKQKKNNNQINQVREVFLSGPGKTLPHPDTGKPLTPKAPAGPEIPFQKDQDARAVLFDWLRAPDNPFFARAFVNRVWGHYFGIGLVHPVDDFSLANPPSNEKLLDALAKDFVAHKFDIRHIEKTVLMSRTYQLSSKTNGTNRFDRNNYAHAYVRPMMAEAVVDVLNCALGTSENFGKDYKQGCKAVEVGASQLQNPALTYAFRIFGRPPRTTACDCERTMDPALPQKLYLMTDPVLLSKFNDPQGRLIQLLKSKRSDDEVLEELFLATLTRLPTAKDRQNFTRYREQVTDRRQAFMDTLWALINTREFILNH